MPVPSNSSTKTPEPDRFFSTPNLLSLARIPLAIVFAFALGPTLRESVVALAVLALAGVTDVFDGYLARRARVDLAGSGSWLDPICDKLFVGIVLGAIHLERGVPLSLLALVVARELIQLPLALVYRLVPWLRHWLRYDFRASALGKAATIVQFAAITALVLSYRGWLWIAVAALVVGLAALIDYVRRAVLIGKRHLEGTG